mmetsp:Transcript_23749/g.51526  ORF Transcript_23749/g.51526 Transcript_23749/m.51526 type:complete len:99 (-) Transcript_23749:379-675(-)
MGSPVGEGGDTNNLTNLGAPDQAEIRALAVETSPQSRQTPNKDSLSEVHLSPRHCGDDDKGETLHHRGRTRTTPTTKGRRMANTLCSLHRCIFPQPLI